MPRAGQTKPPVTPRLPDRIAIGVLTRTFPPELVDRVIAKTGRGERRQRLLVDGLAWMRCWRGVWQVPDKSSIARARQRLGPGPLRELFVEVARPLATQATAGAWYRGLRLMALDGTTFDVADTPANVAAFGRPGSGRGQGAFPQVRLVRLVECGTHAIVDAAMGGLHLGEATLVPSLARSLGPGDGAAGRPGAVRPGAMADLAGNGGGAGVALPPGRQAGGAGGLPRWVLAQRAGPQPAREQADRGPGGGLPPGPPRPPRPAGGLPAADHDPGPRARPRRRAARVVSAAVGAGDRAG